MTTPETPPSAEQTDIEALAEEVWQLLDPDGHGWAAGDGPGVEQTLDAVLSSDWLARHDREVAAKALREAAEDAEEFCGLNHDDCTCFTVIKALWNRVCAVGGCCKHWEGRDHDE